MILICTVICLTTTTIGQYKDIVIPVLLDANAHNATNQSLLLKLTTSKACLILKALVAINYTSVVVSLLIANISSARVTIDKKEILAMDQPLERHCFSLKPAESRGNNKTPVT